MKKIAFFGTPAFTVDFLDSLKNAGLTPSAIITNPDRPVGRGMHIESPAPKHWGDYEHIPVYQPERITPEYIEQLQKEHFDLFVVVAYGKILPEALIQLPTYGTINVHYSLLPKYRGATPVESAILHGDAVTGIAIQQMVYELDAGDIIAQQELAIAPDDTTGSLRAKLNTLAVAILPQTIQDIFLHNTHPIPQDTRHISKTKKITKEHGEINLDDDPIELDRKYRAYFGWPGLYFYTKKEGITKRVKIVEAHFVGGNFIIDTVIPENGKRISFTDFQKMQEQE
ncbi:MAG: methionyl-tRNA formyltransferase [bacterium]